MKPFRSKEFKALQDEWYKKLKKEGFEDIEDPKSDSGHLKAWHSSYFGRRYDPGKFAHKQRYYEEAGRFLHVFQFSSSEERKIWELHTEGVPFRKIAERLKIKVWVVNNTVQFLAAQMQWFLTLTGETDL